MRFLDLIPNQVNYPNISLGEILPYGVLHAFVPIRLLNGFINHVDILRAGLITRYQPHSINLKRVYQFHEDPPPHADLALLGDDVLILGKPKDFNKEPGSDIVPYWFFWSDRDVSDCQLGRFMTYADEDAVVKAFVKYVQEVSHELSHQYSGNDGCAENKGGKPELWLNTKKIRGWISV